MSEIKKTVIIGAGPAGVSAAIQCKRLGIEPLLVDASGTAGGLVVNANLVENYPALEAMTGLKLAEKLKKSLVEHNIKIKKLNITEIKKHKNIYQIKYSNTQKTNTETINALSIIIAVGTKAKKLASTTTIKNLENKNILFYELQEIKEYIKENPSISIKNIIIVGGGEASFDYALSLLEIGIKPTIIVRSKEHRVKGILKSKIETKKVEIHYNTDLESALKKTPYDAVMIAIGRQSALENIEFDFKLDIKNGVSTSEPGIFLLGDARLASLGQFGIAVGDGLSAAHRTIEYINSLDKV
jgi:thioredoxin reductase (NADPH)